MNKNQNKNEGVTQATSIEAEVSFSKIYQAGKLIPF